MGKPDAECVMTEVYSHQVYHKLKSIFDNSFDVSCYITGCTTGALYFSVVYCIMN